MASREDWIEQDDWPVPWKMPKVWYFLKWVQENLSFYFIKPTDNLFFFFGVVTCGILVTWPGMNLCPLQWKHGVLTTGPPRKSPDIYF